MEPKTEHLLSIKVSRIYDRQISTAHFVNEDILRSLLPPNETFETESLPEEYAGKWQILPKSFTHIYLGETFSFYMNLTNDSVAEYVKQVNIKIDIQLSSNNVISLGYVNCDYLDAKQSVDEIMHHEVKELGVHVIIFTVKYVSKNEEALSFRKYFQFQVYKPLDVKTKFYNAESDEVYLESLLQNLTTLPICLERVILEPSDYFDVKELNKIVNGDGEEQWVFGKCNRFNPMECRQYLFCLTPKPELRSDLNLLKTVTVIGKLDIVWTSAIGVKGHLQTSQLERMAPNYNDIRVTVEQVPSQVAFKRKFDIVFRITNYSKHEMEPYLYFDNKILQQPVLWLGISGKALGKLKPLSSVLFSITGYPVKVGLHPIPPMRITNALSKKHYDFSDIAYIFVNDAATQS